MHIRAENDPRFSRRFFFMGIAALGFALYCMYDGLVGYPGRREQGFAEFKADYKSHFTAENRRDINLDQFEAVADDSQRDDWEHYIHDRDIPSRPDVVMQFIMAGISGGLGAFLISIPLRARGRWIEVTDSGINSSWGENFRFEEIEELNKRQWRKKGMAKLTYVANNRRNIFVVDDYKFDRYPTDAVLYLLEQRIDPGRITNGPPEPEPEEGSEVAKVLQNDGQTRG
jgi:hypothetical protein